jgi:hypothetical protein
VKPRVAGVLGIIAALIVSVLSGALLATPPFSILGAVGLVGGTILLGIAATWMVRTSWGPSGWPVYVERAPMSTKKSRRLLWITAFLNCAIIVFFFGLGTWRLVKGDEDWWLAGMQALPFIIGIASPVYWLSKTQMTDDESRSEKNGLQ